MAAPNSGEGDVRRDDALNKEMEAELKRVILECGNGILKPGDSVEELLRKLDVSPDRLFLILLVYALYASCKWLLQRKLIL